VAVTDVCLRPRDHCFTEEIWDDGRIVGYRVRVVGGVYLEVHEMAFNLRLVATDAMLRLEGDRYDFLGYGWCYPKDLGYVAVFSYAWSWEDFNPRYPNATNPPGPWIKAVHSGVYRKPGIGQLGPDDVTSGAMSIRCPRCGRVSHHPEDVRQRYCGNCHQFHDQMDLT
jgi:hypothetical protein